MNKTDFIDAINTKLADSSDITASELREVEINTANEIYSETITEHSLVPSEMTILEKVVSSSTTYVDFFFLMKKEANKCYIKGYISNGSTQAIGYGVNIANIINSEYEAKDTNVGSIPYVQAIEARANTGDRCIILINNDVISINGLIPAGQSVTFDTFYLLKN